MSIKKTVFSLSLSFAFIVMSSVFADVSAQTVKGWPSAAVLAKFSLAGMPAPAGATDISTDEDPDMGYGPVLRISFKYTNASIVSGIRDWLVKNGWKQTGDLSGTTWLYSKGDKRASVDIGVNNNASLNISDVFEDHGEH